MSGNMWQAQPLARQGDPARSGDGGGGPSVPDRQPLSVNLWTFIPGSEKSFEYRNHIESLPAGGHSYKPTGRVGKH